MRVASVLAAAELVGCHIAKTVGTSFCAMLQAAHGHNCAEGRSAHGGAREPIVARMRS
jgi:hypothetical protein